jgi:hypothetical protein
MKYYIYGGETSKLVLKSNRAFGSYDNIEDAVDVFITMNHKRYYKHSYLICDFEIRRPGFFETTKQFGEDNFMNYFTVCEYHYDDEEYSNPSVPSRHDKVSVRTKGFTQEFKNNLSAMRKFESCIKKSKRATMSIQFMTGTYSDDILMYNIATTTAIYQSSHKNAIQKISIDKVELPPAPYATHKFNIFNIKADVKNQQKMAYGF